MAACLIEEGSVNRTKKIQLIKQLIEHGADIYAKNAKGHSCLKYLEAVHEDSLDLAIECYYEKLFSDLGML